MPAPVERRLSTGAHASYFFTPEPPTDGAGSRAADNLGSSGAHPSLYGQPRSMGVGVVVGPDGLGRAGAADVDRYVGLFEEFLHEVT